MKMTGFICHDKYLEQTKKLTDAELGRLFRACMYYHSTGEEPELEDRLSMAFDFIRGDIDSAEEGHKKKCEQNRQIRLLAIEKKQREEESEQFVTGVDENENEQTSTNVNERQRTLTNVTNKIKENKNKIKKINNELFVQFWTEYPRREAKQSAIKAFEKINPDEELLLKMLEAIRRQKQSDQWVKDGGQYIPLPASWLNGKRWEDETVIKNTAPQRATNPVSAYEQRDYSGEQDEARKRMLAMMGGITDAEESYIPDS